MALPVVDASPLYGKLYRLVALLRPALFQLDVGGRERVPLSGGFLLACNHTNGIEVLALGLSSPRQIHFMAKVELFEIHPWISTLLTNAGTFPVRRGRGDRGALGSAAQVLQRGSVVGIFPEGTRYARLGRGKTGAARLAMETGVPIVPVGVAGAPEATARILRPTRRAKITVRFGDPIQLTGDPRDPVAIQNGTTEMMVGIARLLPPEMRGVYADLSVTNPRK